ncbi:hypothetical protein [Levilactobacillus acidifarinae]|nr:hypothetical protein [Levilactobacillus acidifarinae]GEO68315.1 hypothetical protein LAC03_02250 [Levilactobacillus acidifarinae]
MSNFKMAITLDDKAYSSDQLQRLKYERALHVLHEFKELGVKLTDANGRDYSSADLNWLEPDQALNLLEKTHTRLGADQTYDLMKPLFDDSERRWKQFNQRPIEEQGCWLGVTKFDIQGLTLADFQAAMATAQDGETPYQIMPEHYGVKGTIQSGQTIMEAFGCFGEPTMTKGVATPEIPSFTGAQRHTDYPVCVAGALQLADGFDIHVGAIHEVKPVAGGLKIVSTFFCPKDAPKAIADGHTIHFALEVGEMLKLLAESK